MNKLHEKADDPGNCPVCGDELMYTAAGVGEKRRTIWFRVSCICGYKNASKYIKLKEKKV